MKKLLLSFLCLFSFLSVSYAEDFFLFGRTSFFNAQFWERQTGKSGVENRKVMSNSTGGSIGTGMEWTIWDMGVKRGSRIFLFGGLDLVFVGLNYMAETKDTLLYNSINEIKLRGGGSLYIGLKLDLYVGGTFPLTDLKWGFGSDFYLTFHTYSETAVQNSEIFAPFFTPSLLLAYDIFLNAARTKYKITPMLKVGLTCYPLIPNRFLSDLHLYNEVTAENWYSGLYVEFSVSASFLSIPWKK